MNEKLLGGYEVWIDMDRPDDPLSVQDVTFDISEFVKGLPPTIIFFENLLLGLVGLLFYLVSGFVTKYTKEVV